MKKRVSVLISGSGSNLQALIDAAAAPDFPAEIIQVISNKPDAYGLERARKAGISATVIDHKSFKGRSAFEAELDQALRAADTEIICLAGFMRVLTADFVNGWSGRILNIHPSLLPAFRGIHAQKQALEAGVKVTGCTVHLVTPELDDGPILGQAAVDVLPDDDEGTLSARILQQEHRLYPSCLQTFASNFRD